MNSEPHNSADEKWQALLSRATPTFAGETDPPYGFMTSTLARLKAEQGDSDLMEKIGLRALFASMVVLVAVGGFTLGVRVQENVHLNPAVQGIIQADDVSIA